MTSIIHELNNQPQSNNKSDRHNNEFSHSGQHNQLEKYRVLKLMSSGDYLCNDELGNTYLLVCQLNQGGVDEFKSLVRRNFHRSNNNRALLTPFEDITHDGLTFTVYMLPERSQSMTQILSWKSKSQIYCLSLLYTLINKVVKPLLQIFSINAHKWLHSQNIWIKQSTIFYILNQRKKPKLTLKKTQKKLKQQQTSQNMENEMKQKYQKQILRKLCCILAPYFKIEPQLKSFLSTIVDAMLNEEFTIQQVCLLLNDRKKRKSFIDGKKQFQFKINENNQTRQFVSIGNQLWGKKRYYYVDNNRRGLKNQTLNIENIQRTQMSNNYNYNYEKAVKNIGQTIHIPPSFKSRKRSSLSNSGMFNFADKSNKKKKSSVSSEKSKNRYTSSRVRGFSQNIEQNIQKKLRSQIDFMQNGSRQYSIHVTTVKARAQKKFEQKIQSQHQSIKSARSIEQEQKHLKAFLEEKSKQKNRKFSTIDISQLRYSLNAPKNRRTIQQINNKNQIKRQLFITSAQAQNTSQAGYFRFEKQNQNKIVDPNKQYETIQIDNSEQNTKAKQSDIAKQIQKLKQIQREHQRQIERLKEKQRQRQRSRQKQKKRQLQQQRQLQKQRQRQLQILKEKQREREEQIQRQKQKLKKKQQQMQRERRKQKQMEDQKQKHKQANEKNIKRNQSAHQMTNKDYSQKAQQFNLDQIEIIEPTLKTQIQNKKRQQQLKEKQMQKQRQQQIQRQRQKQIQRREKQKQKQKNNKPPLPNQGKQSNSLSRKASNKINQEQLQQIVLNNTKKQIPKQVKQSVKKEQINKQTKKEQISKEAKKQQVRKAQGDSGSRTKTVTSQIASSCGPKKPVSKQVAQYMHMINKMGQSVAKSSKISAKLEGFQWFTGIYFIYKRFLFERKRIEKWLQNNQPNLTRYNQKNKVQWQQWFKSEQKKTLLQKVKVQNQSIVNSILKMNKKIMKKSLPGNFLFHAALSRHSQQQSKIAVSEVVKEYDELDQKQKLEDEEILNHANQLMNSIYIIAELDGKIKQKKPLIQIIKKRNQEELSEYSDYLYELYIKE